MAQAWAHSFAGQQMSNAPHNVVLPVISEASNCTLKQALVTLDRLSYPGATEIGSGLLTPVRHRFGHSMKQKNFARAVDWRWFQQEFWYQPLVVSKALRSSASEFS